MSDNHLTFIDTETTGLDPRVHDAWEVCWWHDDKPYPMTRRLAHTLDHADPRALEVGGYWDRTTGPEKAYDVTGHELAVELRDVTLVGANPAFDAAFLTKVIGTPVWRYRLIDVCAGAMWVLGWDRPRSLLDTATCLRETYGYDIPSPDHTAEADVRTTRAAYYALRALAPEEDAR